MRMPLVVCAREDRGEVISGDGGREGEVGSYQMEGVLTSTWVEIEGHTGMNSCVFGSMSYTSGHLMT